MGINSTPAIDSKNHIIYVMAYVQVPGSNPPIYEYQLHALDLTTLLDEPYSPVTVTASHTLSDGSTIYQFDASVQRQRPALLLANGNIYAAFGSFCDFTPEKSRGWLLGWNATTLAPLAHNTLVDQLATSQPFHDPHTGQHTTYYLAAVWMSGYGPAADDQGNILFRDRQWESNVV